MAKKRSVYKLSKSTALLIALIALALLFIFYQFYVVNNNTLSTQIANKTTVYDTVTTQGVFIRQEQPLSQAAGVMVQSVEDGGKVAKNEEVAKVFGSEEAARNYTKILQLQSQLDYYNDLQSQTVGEAADITTMDQSILETVGAIARQKNGRSLSAMAELDLELNDVLTRRKLLTGEKIDVSPIISSLEQQIAALQGAGAAPQSTVTTELSGNFSKQTDGFETYFDYERAAEYTVDEIKTYLEATKAPQSTQAMGKMITDFTWYIACVVDSDLISTLKVGSQVSVCVSSNASLVLPATVYARNMAGGQSGECALVLACDVMDQDISALRNEKIEIRLRSYSGLRVDSRAIRTVEEQKGVYVLISNKVVFRKIEVLYSGEGFVIAALDNSAVDSIRLYDAVIVEGRDLYDGKFIN